MADLKKEKQSGEPVADSWRVGEFHFDPRTGKLSRGGETYRLEPQVSTFLALLVKHAGETVSRDTINRQIWPDRVVSDDAVRAMVKKLREALGDNARDPRYLRTLPLKGYALIARTGPVTTGRRTSRMAIAIAASGITAVLVAAIAMTAIDGRGAGEPEAVIEQLTGLPGSEVSPDYSPAAERLVFSHRASKDDTLQLYAKELPSGRVQRLTWDSANYANAHWSPDGTRLVYTRSQGEQLQHYLAGYDPETGIVDPRPLPQGDGQRRYLQGWSRSGEAIYLKDAGQPQGIWRLELTRQSLHQLTAPSVNGVGDSFARESHDGRRLALLRGLEDNKRELLVLDLATGTLLHTRLLTTPVDRLAWHPDGLRIGLSGFNGELMEYRLDEDRFVPRPTPDRFINDLFFQCGNDCFLMRRHNGNFLDLEEQPDPFAAKSLMAADRFDLPGAEDFPHYSRGGERLFYASLARDRLYIQRQDPQQRRKTLVSLPVETRIQALQASPDGTMVAGIAGRRLFTVSGEGGELHYLTSDLDLASAPTWSADSSALFYARREKGASVIYRFQPGTGRHAPLLHGYAALRILADGRAVAIDEQNRAWLLVSVDQAAARRELGKVASAQPNRWQVRGDWLYYTEHRGNDAFVVRIRLDDGRRMERLLAHNRFRLHFDLHPRADRMIGVRSMLAESDLVKLSLAPVSD